MIGNELTHYVFLDESGDHCLHKVDPQFPVFALAAVVVPIKYYHMNLDVEMDEFKRHYWGRTDIILHSRDIRKAMQDFNILQNPEVRSNFFYRLNALMGSLDYTIVASVIDKRLLCQQYSYPASPYYLTLVFIMERLFFMFKSKGFRGKLIAESRGPKPDAWLRQVYENCRNCGSRYVSATEFCAHLHPELHFNTKAENINGLQLADLVAYPIARKVLNSTHQNRAYDVISSKLYCGPFGTVNGYGLKVFP